MLAKLLELFFSIYILMMFIRIMGSWVPQFSQTKWMLFVGRMTDPYLNIFRRFIPPLGGVVDLSPILAFLVLQFAQKFLLSMVR
jgi:YggT family protein